MLRSFQCDRGPVLENMNNTTLPQESGTPLDSPGFLAYSILMFLIIFGAGVVIEITAVVLAIARSIPRPLRLFLINLLLAGLVMGLGMILIVFTSTPLILLGPEHPRPPRYLCRVYVWLFGVGSVARPWSLAAFSLSVQSIVQFEKTISPPCATVIISILWLGPNAVGLFILIPTAFEAQFVDSVACFPDDNSTVFIEARHTFTAIWVTAGGLVPMTISIAVPIICLCYIKKNIVTEDTQYRKAMAKFSLFLVLGGTINLAGQVIPGTLAYHMKAPGVYHTYGRGAVSLLPTPIIIIAYLKPVQEQIKKMFTCVKLPKEAQKSKSAPQAFLALLNLNCCRGCV